MQHVWLPTHYTADVVTLIMITTDVVTGDSVKVRSG